MGVDAAAAFGVDDVGALSGLPVGALSGVPAGAFSVPAGALSVAVAPDLSAVAAGAPTEAEASEVILEEADSLTLPMEAGKGKRKENRTIPTATSLTSK